VTRPDQAAHEAEPDPHLPGEHRPGWVAGDPERERAALRQTIAEQTSHIDRLAALTDSLIQQQQELRRTLQDVHTQLFERDEEIERLRTRVRELDVELALERKRLRSLRSSRWWRLRQAIARVVGR
jgi:archaellum component FlaC